VKVDDVVHRRSVVLIAECRGIRSMCTSSSGARTWSSDAIPQFDQLIDYPPHADLTLSGICCYLGLSPKISNRSAQSLQPHLFAAQSYPCFLGTCFPCLANRHALQQTR
jgi:hypothetical protein